MREHSRDRGRLEDILKFAQNVEKIVNGISFDDFVNDIRIYYSVMKNVEVIGEAANMLTRHFREKHTELPWRQIVSMRNVLVHGYAQVSDIDLWQTATTDIIYSLKDHRGRVNALQMDDRKLVTASADNTIKVWNLSTGVRQYSLLGGSLQVRANVPFVL